MIKWFINLFSSKYINEQYEQEDFMKLIRNQKAMLWAFGNSEPQLLQNMLIQWDKLHSNIFKITPKDSIYKTMSKIYYQYKKNNPND